MAFFRERNNIKSEYSGYQQASKALRERLAAIVQKRSAVHMNDMAAFTLIQRGKLDHACKLRLNTTCIEAILSGSYDEAFEAYEVFLSYATRMHIRHDVLEETRIAFESAGSVYAIQDDGTIVLQISEETAASIDAAESSLEKRSSSALDFFRRALRDLLSRKRSANDVVKDFSVAMENYLEAVTGKENFSEALKALQTNGLVAPTQRLILEKMYAYRGDADGVAHSGNTIEPSEADAVWFLETFVAQIKLIEAKTMH